MTRFLLDAMCGGVLAHLRMCGHDAAFAPERDLESDDAIAAAARDEDRTVVTRDRELARMADTAILVRSLDPRDQLVELVDAGITLALPSEPTRCSRCNGSLRELSPGDTTPEYAPDPGAQRVWACVDCGQCFWRGSHWDNVADTLAEVRARASPQDSGCGGEDGS